MNVKIQLAWFMEDPTRNNKIALYYKNRGITNTKQILIFQGV